MNEAAQRETISADGAAGSALFLNAAILDFGDASIDVDVLPSPSDIRELRRDEMTRGGVNSPVAPVAFPKPSSVPAWPSLASTPPCSKPTAHP